jgi:hypothetical protein
MGGMTHIDIVQPLYGIVRRLSHHTIPLVFPYQTESHPHHIWGKLHTLHYIYLRETSSQVATPQVRSNLTLPNLG